MMKSEINLLPPFAVAMRRKRLYQRQSLYIVRRLIAGILFIYVLLGVVGAFFWLRQQNFEAMTQSQQDVTQLEKQVRDVNTFVSAFQKRVDDHPAWSPLVEDIVSVMPSGTRLQRLIVRADQNAIQVEGVADSRTTVLSMQAELEKLEGVSKVEAPLRNFASGQQGEFSFTVFRYEAAVK